MAKESRELRFVKHRWRDEEANGLEELDRLEAKPNWSRWTSIPLSTSSSALHHCVRAAELDGCTSGFKNCTAKSAVSGSGTAPPRAGVARTGLNVRCCIFRDPQE